MTIALISHPDCEKHEMGAGHPERPQRLGAIHDRLIASGLSILLHHYDAPLATREQLQRVHDSNYIDSIFAQAPEAGRLAWIDPDTAMNEYTLTAALRAAGAAVMAVDLVLGGEEQCAFCNVRPPGHHAEHNRAMGFCFFNNVAVGAAHALQFHGLERVAIVDFDVHHGNGSEDIFRSEPRVLLCSTFQHPFYPYSGSDTQLPNMVNVPLPAGSRSKEFREAVEQYWLPALSQFKPQLVMISAGFDAHCDDDMAGLCLVDQDYAWVTRQMKTVAAKTAQGRIVSTLEGGYELHALARSAEAHIAALTE
ncbi:MAG: histone deacetylase family protein [Gammaproteobacteria bacterium]|jgi:acetoin utilization deacetylase AcuC-like enzyme|nr:histone deacetylase family protein [Gammaproteobacteria bacterium]